MAVSPNELLGMAQELVSGNREIDFRTSANRAYYSAFHFCMNLTATLPLVPSGGRRSHERLINRLKNHQVRRATREFDLNVRMLGEVLRQAKPIRVHADYRISGNFERYKAEGLILMATKIAEIVSEIGHS